MLHPHAPVIGASGSIAAVTGAFLALFPRSRIKVLVFFFVIGVYSIPSLWFIGFYFAIDLLRQSGSLLGLSGERVAYMAHLAGYLYGFAMGFTLLATGLLKHEEYDVFFLFKQSRRRAAFRAASRDKTGGLWETSSRTESGRLPSRRQTREADRPLSPHQQRLAEARAAINGHLDRHDVETAAALYADLLDEAPEVVLTEPRQLDVANQLYARDDARRAAIAYERLLASYPASPHATEVRLLLGLIYARRLARPDRARELVEAARARLHDPEQRSLAEQLLAELAT
ncbi:MAG: rhomboid family intramembrane serine protease, partial [Planctomycetota bacterium]|jgi:tetratricopeptide (TPR) repeat protein